MLKCSHKSIYTYIWLFCLWFFAIYIIHYHLVTNRNVYLKKQKNNNNKKQEKTYKTKHGGGGVCIYLRNNKLINFSYCM